MIHLVRLLSAIMIACFALPLAAAGPTAPPGKMARLNGIDMHYEDRGSGEPLLLLHGFGMCGPGDWGHVADELSKSYRVIMPDLRGHGWSTNPAGAFTMRQSASDVNALLEHLNLSGVRAMGISAGGMTLLHLAIQHPERVGAMVLIGATNRFPDQARKVLREVGFDVLPPPVREMLRKCASRGDEQVRSLMGQFRGFADSQDDMNLDPPQLSRIKTRTLIVHGDRDEFFPVEVPVLLYSSIAGSELWIVPRGDHVPIYDERRAEFLRVTREFLDRKQP
jgi:pimeloyl-ACP methyl ester carboxylesterase